MIPITLTELAASSGGRLVCRAGEERTCITSVTTDSRTACPGALFGAIKGERVDGHDYIGKAAASGASAVLAEKEPQDADIPYILVPSTIKALQAIAADVLKKAGIPVVAVTGSVGKTSTKEMVAAVLSQKYNILKTKGNHNNSLGLPLTIFELENEHQMAVLEHGISRFGEMSVLAGITHPDVCVFTNVGDCHLEDLGSREGVFRAKGEMFDFMPEDAKLVFYGDDAILGAQESVRGIRPLFYGLSDRNDVWAENVRSRGLAGSSFTLHIPGGTAEVNVPAPGIHQVVNALAAAAAGSLFGLSTDEIVQGVASYVPVAGRFNLVDTGRFCLIDDCYNANPASMKASLHTLSYAEGRKVAVLGDMGELGTDEEALHGSVGAAAAGEEIDVLLCAGPLSRFIFEEAKAADPAIEAFHFDTKEELIRALPGILKENDTILVKASHFCGFDEVVNAIKEFK